ncbi:hypothetical protein IP88_05425 [alpha proteobacterium AAP81b]|nr:hypothetical protein IP88_05425 [alpha proteobacterium AAP81b]
MIVFDLKCGSGHVFEAWFGSSADYESQQARGLVACPLCDSAEVTKAAMAPAVPAKSNRGGGAVPMAAGNDDGMARLLAMQREMEANSDYVGRRFAAEARAIHDNGETRAVHGEATLAEARALVEDGVPLLPLPFRPLARSDA